MKRNSYICGMKVSVEVGQNKYTTWYEQLVEGAKNRSLPEDTYTEKHHIVPRCMGGSNKKENIVELTAREHYIAHLLLWKMSMPEKWNNKMMMALHVMINGSGKGKQKVARSEYLVNSRIFEKNRKKWRDYMSESRKGEGNHFYGKKHTEETKERIKKRNAETKEIRSAKLSGEGNGMHGKKHTKETLDIMSKKSKEYWASDENKSKVGKRTKKQWEDPEWRKKQTQSRKSVWDNRTQEERSAIGRKAAETRKKNAGKLPI